jgi:hypothetical protein
MRSRALLSPMHLSKRGVETAECRFRVKGALRGR